MKRAFPAFSQELKQTQKMSLRQTQSLDVLTLPVLDLRQRIQQELEENPALEVLSDSSEISLDELREDEAVLGGDDAVFKEYGFSFDGGWEENHNFIEGVLSRPDTLRETLLWQMRLTALSKEAREAAEILIQNLDKDGFHLIAPEELFKAEDFKNIPKEAVEEALYAVRRLEPCGCCTSSYIESLEVQSAIFYPQEAENIKKMLSFLEELEKGKYAAAACKSGVTEDEAKRLFALIKKLFPFPGRAYSSPEENGTRYIIPDIQVVLKNDGVKIILNKEEIPALGLAPFFMKQNFEKGEERDFVKENVREAKWFIQTINRRNHTLLRVTRAIVHFQKNFFLYGPKFLSPLTLRDIAQELGVHEATVSRAANGKYVQTAYGVFELRRFFTGVVSGKNERGAAYSKEAVKEIIKEITLSAQGRLLSDGGISEVLKERGVQLARRTVAKYRKELAIDSSYSRKN
ncbi:MAG: RNA polymerase factor sigma-54 [Spirochaetaceae bacterium]|jgi:RNA polymerase sigma-54 factor|nr:RNA polymerase factor sigma-54 [Spirochaetaceae bacterium]